MIALRLLARSDLQLKGWYAAVRRVTRALHIYHYIEQSVRFENLPGVPIE
jgi:hypothetical protein